MAADPFADPGVVERLWRPLSAYELLRAASLCDMASAILRAQYPGLDAQVESGGVDDQIAAYVTAQMVIRAMASGGVGVGVSQQTQGTGPFSVSQTFSNPMGNLFITAAEDTMIRGYLPGALSLQYGE